MRNWVSKWFKLNFQGFLAEQAGTRLRWIKFWGVISALGCIAIFGICFFSNLQPKHYFFVFHYSGHNLKVFLFRLSAPCYLLTIGAKHRSRKPESTNISIDPLSTIRLKLESFIITIQSLGTSVRELSPAAVFLRRFLAATFFAALHCIHLSPFSQNLRVFFGIVQVQLVSVQIGARKFL